MPIANDGKMMKPYLVNAVKENGLVVKENQPEVLEQAVCSEQTLKLLQDLLKGVCNDPHGTGYTLVQRSALRGGW